MKKKHNEEYFEIFGDRKRETDEKAMQEDTELEDSNANQLCCCIS